MGILDLNLAEAVELPLCPAEDTQLEIVSAEIARVASDPTDTKRQIHTVYRAVSLPNTKKVHHRLSLPHTDDDSERKADKLVRIRKMCEAFGIDLSQPFQTEGLAEGESSDDPLGSIPDWTGRTGWAVLTIADPDPRFGQRNEIAGFSRRG